MSWQFLNSKTQAEFIRRIEAIKTDSQRKFGKLSAAALLAHLNCALVMSLGEVPIKDQSNWFARVIFRRLAFESPMPWPKGKIKAPTDLFPSPGEIEIERTKLIASVKRFVEISEREPERTQMHPMFGPLTLKYFQRIHGKHFEHHFQQFGV